MSSQVPIGCDISTSGVHLALTPKGKPHFLAFEGDWTTRLGEIVPAGALVALEPTGWHYSAPIIQALKYIGAQVLIVENAATGNIRREIVSPSKTDQTDARTLYGIARMYLDGIPLKNAHPADMNRISDVRALRMLVHHHNRVGRQVNQTTNRLHQIAFSIAPVCDQYFNWWLHCAGQGQPHADGIIAISRQAEAKHPGRNKNLKELADSLPTWADGSDMLEPCALEVETLRFLEPQQELIERRITSLLERGFSEITELWRTVPGSSDIHIAKILSAADGNPRAYTADQFLAAVGGQPKFAQSGKKSASTMNVAGFRPARAAATLWAMFLISPKAPDNPLRETAARAKKRGVKIRPRIRAQLLNILWGIARSGSAYYFPGGSENV